MPALKGPDNLSGATVNPGGVDGVLPSRVRRFHLRLLPGGPSRGHIHLTFRAPHSYIEYRFCRRLLTGFVSAC